MKSPQEIISGLAQFTGSETWTKWSVLFPDHLLTDGAKHLADEAECYWLMDLIGSYQSGPVVRNNDFQVWTLKKSIKGWTVEAEDGNGNIIVTQMVEHSDFPLEAIMLWACRNEFGGVTIMLPTEY